MGLFPLIATLNTYGGTNRVSTEMTKQLQSINTQLTDGTSQEECDFFMDSMVSWVLGVTGGGSPRYFSDDSIFLLQLSVEPVRCDDFFPLYDGNVTTFFCEVYDLTTSSSTISDDRAASVEDHCAIWRTADSTTSITDLAEMSSIRTGAINVEIESGPQTLTTASGNVSTTFRVTAKYNHTYSVQPA
jgi:hypothetical protein